MPPKKSIVNEAQSRRAPSQGKTVRLRAIERGQYGRPTADIIEPGTLFNIAVKDLEPRETAVTEAHQYKDDDRRINRLKAIDARDTVTVDGTIYLLPSWCEEASKPASTEPEPQQDEPTDQSDDVI